MYPNFVNIKKNGNGLARNGDTGCAILYMVILDNLFSKHFEEM